MEFISEKYDSEEYFPLGVPVRSAARAHFKIDEMVRYSLEKSGAEYSQFARILADALNKDIVNTNVNNPRPAKAGEILAFMILQEIFRYLISYYGHKAYPGIFREGLLSVRKVVFGAQPDTLMPVFVAYYTPQKLIHESISPEAFLNDTSASPSNVERTLREMIIIQLDHENMALSTYQRLYDNTELTSLAPLTLFMEKFEQWLAHQPPFPGSSLPLLEVLREPIWRHPDSLEAQVDYLLRRWRQLLPESLFKKWLVARGILQEETFFRGHGPGPIETYRFRLEDFHETEAFSPDTDWMPKVVLIAKLAYVWLDQLSKKYGRTFHLLSDIPDAELDRLAHWGFNALWLIGVWERSSASRQIKHRMGNSDAAASAYSLYDYVIAQELGGEAALKDLARRAWARGIRLAGDMVPNHTGIYSKWVIEYPERFLQLNYPPFPSYRFTGPDLSEDSRVSIVIEDGYWTRSDAAVVFQRRDNWTGNTIYIYHGNDGTNMPWNDTAQLDFLRPDTREAVIQTILQVARRFPIIRFDAAMTLAKRHYQRLWFPRPGEGGAIPSRAEFGMTKEMFDQAMPAEFWREVVDRVALEAPNTLLLAEAFWLMEGYFVRTLGMHRVYNSAFMNMLKMEDNANYRQTIKNVLEFSPEVLQRFVNFMNNPDEDTAEAQFGKGDKYFGVAVMLATMPGLPMFGHGQIEGFTEKYGMEYRRAYRDELPDQGFIERHEREIFPLLRKRSLFSGAQFFALFDFVTPSGWVDENVFAYSNRHHGEYALVVYNNAYNFTQGTVYISTAINVGKGEEKKLERRTLGEALGLPDDPHWYEVWRDERTKLEYLHHTESLIRHGIYLELHAYDYKTFFFVGRIYDSDASWGRLHGALEGKGVPSIQEAYLEMQLAAILEPFRAFMTADMIRHVIDSMNNDDLLGPWRYSFEHFVSAIGAFASIPLTAKGIVKAVTCNVKQCLETCHYPPPFSLPTAVLNYWKENLVFPESEDTFAVFLRVPVAFCLLYCLAKEIVIRDLREESADCLNIEPLSKEKRKDIEKILSQWIHEWLLWKPIHAAFERMSHNGWLARKDICLLQVCLMHHGKLRGLEVGVWGPIVYTLFNDPAMQEYLLLHWYDNRRWMNKEHLEKALFMLFLSCVIVDNDYYSKHPAEIVTLYDTVLVMLDAAADTGYDFDWFLSVIK